MVTVALSKAYLDGQIELDGDEPKANENDQNVITNGVLNGQEGVTDDCEDEPSDWNDTANDSANRTNVSLNGPKEPSDWDETMSPRVVCNDQREPSDWDETINSQNNTSNNQGDMSNSQSDTLSSQKYTSNSPIDTSPIDTSSQSGFTSSSNEIKLSELTDQMSNSNLKDDEETDEQEESDEDRIRKYSQNLPDQLLLDRENDWPVMVLSVTNRSGIVVRLTEHTEKLDELIAEMQDFYNEKKLGKPVIDLILDRIYAVVFDGKRSMDTVRLISFWFHSFPPSHRCRFSCSGNAVFGSAGWLLLFRRRSVRESGQIQLARNGRTLHAAAIPIVQRSARWPPGQERQSVSQVFRRDDAQKQRRTLSDRTADQLRSDHRAPVRH